MLFLHIAFGRGYSRRVHSGRGASGSKVVLYRQAVFEIEGGGPVETVPY